MAKEKSKDEKPSIIIKRVKKISGGHHGGAWKVAYADFVTAMMAFFLLLWLLSVTTETQKKKIADYFAPTDPRISQDQSGSGSVLGGRTLSPEESAKTDESVEDPQGTAQTDDESRQAKKEAQALDQQDDKAFKEAEEEIRKAVENNPDLKEFAQNLLIDQTPEGLRIQIIDQDGKPMFEIGSAKPLPQTVKLLGVVTGVIKDLPNKLSVRGHTDSIPYGNNSSYTNWELSADRANASRRVMLAASLSADRVENVQGKADREPLIADDLKSAKNRRVSIILLKQSLVAGAKRAEQRFKLKKEPPQPKKREEGVIYFP